MFNVHIQSRVMGEDFPVFGCFFCLLESEERMFIIAVLSLVGIYVSKQQSVTTMMVRITTVRFQKILLHEHAVIFHQPNQISQTRNSASQRRDYINSPCSAPQCHLLRQFPSVELA